MTKLLDKYPRISDMLPKAKRRMPHFAAEYLFSGTGYDLAMEYNEKILKEILFVPRYLKGIVEADTKTNILGRSYAAPFGIAPMGLTGLMWPGAEEALAKMAVKNNIPFTLSTVACASIEDIGPHLDGKGWFQLYPPIDKEIRNDLLRRAQNSGYDVLVVTADIPSQSRRERLRIAGVSVPPKNNIRNFYHAMLCPSWSLGTLVRGMPQFRTMNKYNQFMNKSKGEKVLGSGMKRFLDWKYLEEVKEIWKGPVILKGLMHIEDALRAKELVDAVYLSNHGGRQLDISASPLQILPDIRRELGPDFHILIDSGFYSGQDIVKALMLGADFVMVGRPFMIGLGALGHKGAFHTHDILKDEIENIMEQICSPNIEDIKKQKLSVTKDFSLKDIK